MSSFGGISTVSTNEVEELQESVAEIQSVVTPTTLDYNSVITLSQSGSMIYNGADTSVELSALPPHVPGATLVILFPSGTITGDNTVTLADSLNPPASVANGEIFDSSLHYRVWVTAVSTTMVVSTVTVCVDTDFINPTITDAAIDGYVDIIDVTFSESVNWLNASGFSIANHTIDSISGSGTDWSIQLVDPFSVDESRSLVWTSDNTVYDLASNQLLASSIAITNTLGYPTISSAEVTDDALTIVFSEAVDVTGVTGLTLVGTSAVFASVTSGSGTTTVIFALDTPVDEADTITLTITTPNDIESSISGVSLQAASGISVINNTTSYIWQDTFDVDDGSWHALNSAVFTIAGGVLNRSDVGGYRIVYNDTDVTLPAAYTVTATVPHSTLSTNYWGLAALFDSGDNSGIRVIVTNPSNVITAGSSTDWNNGDVEVTVTGGFPASWSTDQNHTFGFTVNADGSCIILLDGFEYGTFTCTNNQGETGLGIAIVGEGNDRDWLSIEVTSIS